MMRTCPECGGDLTDLEPGAGMGSRPKRYDCPHCALRLESDAGNMLFEVDD